MPLVRFLLETMIVGTLSGIAAVQLAEYFDLNTAAVIAVATGVMLMLLGRIDSLKRLRAEDAPGSDAGHARLALLALGAWLAAAGLVAVAMFDGQLWPHLVWLLGVTIALPGVVHLIDAKAGAAVADERSRLLASQSTWIGWVAMLLAGFLAGVADLIDLARFSGAEVGFAAATVGVLSALTAQAWLEWRDSK